MRDTLLKERLQRVVIRMRGGIFRKNAGKNRRAIGRASHAGGGLAIRRREGPQSNQGDCRIAGPHSRHGTVRQMNREARWNRISRQTERGVLEERSADVS